MPEFCIIFAQKILFPRILMAIQGSKAESERIRPKHTSFYRRNRLNKPFVRLRTLLYIISLDA